MRHVITKVIPCSYTFVSFCHVRYTHVRLSALAAPTPPPRRHRPAATAPPPPPRRHRPAATAPPPPPRRHRLAATAASPAARCARECSPTGCAGVLSTPCADYARVFSTFWSKVVVQLFPAVLLFSVVLFISDRRQHTKQPHAGGYNTQQQHWPRQQR